MNRFESFLNDNKDILHTKKRSLFVLGLVVLSLVALPITVTYLQQQQNIRQFAATTSSIIISDFAFQPSQITIQAGDTIIWTNNSSSVTHTVTSDTGAFDSGPIAPGQSFSFTFTTAGTYTYKCSIHPDMTGTVTVIEAPASPTPSDTPTPPVGTDTPTPTTVPITDTGIPTSIPTNPPPPQPTNTSVPQPTQPPPVPTSTLTPTLTPTPTVMASVTPVFIAVNGITSSPTPWTLPTTQPTTRYVTLPPVSLPPLYNGTPTPEIIVANQQATRAYIFMIVSGIGIALLLILVGLRIMHRKMGKKPVFVDFGTDGSKKETTITQEPTIINEPPKTNITSPKHDAVIAQRLEKKTEDINFSAREDKEKPKEESTKIDDPTISNLS